MAALDGVRPPVRQVIRKVAAVHRPIRTCELLRSPARLMPTDRSRHGAVGRVLKNLLHTVTEHCGSEYAERRQQYR
jgi:hypothetical protein